MNDSTCTQSKCIALATLTQVPFYLLVGYLAFVQQSVYNMLAIAVLNECILKHRVEFIASKQMLKWGRRPNCRWLVVAIQCKANGTRMEIRSDMRVVAWSHHHPTAAISTVTENGQTNAFGCDSQLMSSSRLWLEQDQSPRRGGSRGLISGQ